MVYPLKQMSLQRPYSENTWHFYLIKKKILGIQRLRRQDAFQVFTPRIGRRREERHNMVHLQIATETHHWEQFGFFPPRFIEV